MFLPASLPLTVERAIEMPLLHFDIREGAWCQPYKPKRLEPRPACRCIRQRSAQGLRNNSPGWGGGRSVFGLSDSTTDLHDTTSPRRLRMLTSVTCHVQETRRPTHRPAQEQTTPLAALAVIPSMEIAPERDVLQAAPASTRAAAIQKQTRPASYSSERGELPVSAVIYRLPRHRPVLDHRITRSLVCEMARAKPPSNLFAYTGKARLHAALGAASAPPPPSIVTLIDCGAAQFRIDGMRRNAARRVSADALEWLKQNDTRRYGLIYLGPAAILAAANDGRDTRQFNATLWR